MYGKNGLPLHPHNAFPPSPPHSSHCAASDLFISLSPSVRLVRDLIHPTRCVLLRSIPYGVEYDDLQALLQRVGPLRNLGAHQRSHGGHGSVRASFFDLHHAFDGVRLLYATCTLDST